MQIEFIDLKAQYARLKSSVDANIQAVLDHGQFIMGPEVRKLEIALENKTGAKHAIGCANGTDALLLAMMALGIGDGDEVITSPFTFIATAEMIAVAGATPVFVDIDPKTYNIDPMKIESAITPRTKAIMPVSLYGQCADMDAINALAAKHNLAVIEDGAQSLGATYNGKQSCNLSTIGCTSFFPSKPLGCYGDGGACFTSDDKLAELMRSIRVHGQTKRYHHPYLGLNARLDTLQAAVLLAKMDVFDDEIRLREEAAARYAEMLAPELQAPYIAPGNTSVYAQYTLQVENRAEVQAKLKEAGVPTAVHYPLPLHMQPVFAHLGQGKGSFPTSEAAAERVMSLPMSPYIKEEEIRYVVNTLKTALGLGNAA